MNIFYLDKDIDKCVQFHCDKHVVKMILEYAQILCTAQRELDSNANSLLYKATHKNHPSSLWARETSDNYIYLYNLFVGLSNEYTYRYSKTHLTYSKLKDLLYVVPKNIPIGEFREPFQCMPEEFRSDNTVQSYRTYYKSKQKSFDMKYTNREAPEWLVND
jgi:hypothetical protein